MKLILLFLSVLHLNFVSGYNIKPVNGVQDRTLAVNSDSDGYTYAITEIKQPLSLWEQFLHKITPNNTVLSSMLISTYTDSAVHIFAWQIFVTRQNDIYLLKHDRTTDDEGVLYIIRSDFQTSEVIGYFYDDIAFLDYFDNLIYHGEYGIQILHPNSTIPVKIQNLEGFHINGTENIVIDQDGNVYLGVESETTNDRVLALIPKEEFENEIPEAEFYYVLDNEDQYIADLLLDDENNLWIFVTDHTAGKGYVRKLQNGTAETVFEDVMHPNIKGLSAKDRIYVIASDYYQKSTPAIYYLTLDGQMGDVGLNSSLESQIYFTADGVADKNGTAYFKSNKFTDSLGSMLIIKPEENFARHVDLGFDRPDLLHVDLNENVWLKSYFEHIYYIRKEETDAIRISDGEPKFCDSFHSNSVTKNVYMACLDALYVSVGESLKLTENLDSIEN